MNEQAPVLDTHFIKNDGFKTVHGSGFYGGFTPTGYLSMFVYTERIPIPKRISYEVGQNPPELGPETDREVRTGLVREVQFGVLFDVETAESLIEWLTSKVKEYHRVQTDSSK